MVGLGRCGRSVFGLSRVDSGSRYAFLTLGGERRWWLTEGITSKYKTNTVIPKFMSGARPGDRGKKISEECIKIDLKAY